MYKEDYLSTEQVGCNYLYCRQFCVLKTDCNGGKYASPLRENTAGTKFYNKVLNREDISRSRRKSRPVYMGEMAAARLEIYSAMLVTTKLRERTRWQIEWQRCCATRYFKTDIMARKIYFPVSWSEDRWRHLCWNIRWVLGKFAALGRNYYVLENIE